LLFPANSNFKISTPSEFTSNISLSYEENIIKAADFLNNTQFNQTLGLCREAPHVAPGNTTYWLVSDNLLAYHALKYYYSETAEKIRVTMKNYGYFRSFKHEVIFGTTIPYIPFRKATNYTITQIGDATIKTEICDRNETLNATDYADLCIFAVLHYHWIGNETGALEFFNMAEDMWDSKGLYDKASEDAENKGETLIYATFKLALILYASKILKQPLENKTDIEEVLWRMQDENGGLHTDYDANLNYTGSDVNTETTVLAIIAYKYQPKIMNRPASYPPPLSVPPDYEKIQDAIISANSGDTIKVSAGIYHEHIILGKALQLIGENQNSTIIDGDGTGTVVQIDANNVSVINFTISNAGRIWTIPSHLDSCIQGRYRRNVHIENNILAGAAVCIWFDHSSFVDINANIVFNATYAGIIGYATNNVTIYHNLVYNYGSDGIHLDGGSKYCRILTNTVKNGFVGISLETDAESLYPTANNLIDGNCIFNNTLSSVGIWKCNTNVFRRNNMTNEQHNLVIWGYSLSNFIQDIDNSNIVNNKVLYYLTNCNNLTIDPSSYPNLRDLAIVNCSNITVRDFNLTYNRDGILLAGSTHCTLINMTLSDNREPVIYGGFPFIYGGLIFFESNNNTIVNSRVCNSSYGVCLYHSDWNIFYHNSLINNYKQVVPDLYSPFQNVSSGYFSVSVWDNGFEGNYWSDYRGVDGNRDGIGDLHYVVSSRPSNQSDNHPLMGPFHSYRIINLSRVYEVTLVSNSTISDFAVHGIEHPENIEIVFNVTGETGIGFCRICIPHDLMSPPYNVTIDNGKTSVLDIHTAYENGTHTWMYFTYPHTTHQVTIIPEFPFNLIATIFMITSTIATILAKKRRKFAVKNSA